MDFTYAETPFSENFYNTDSSAISLEIYKNQAIPEKTFLEKSMFVFESNFNIDTNLKSEKLSLAVGSMDYPCQIFLNGIYLVSFGDIQNYKVSKIQFSTEVELPQNLLNFGDSVNKLTIQIYPNEGIKPALFKYFISSKEIIVKWIFYRNFVRIDLVKAASIFSLILFLYFLFGFIQNRDKKDKRYLIFAFICIAFILTYINISISHNYIDELFIYKISRSSAPFLTMLLLLFTIKNTGYLNKKAIIILLFIPISISALLIILQSDLFGVEKMFALFAKLINFPYFLIIFILSLISAIKTKKLNKIILFIGLLVVFFTMISDTINYISHINPYTWLIPLGFFSFLISIFFILASEQTHIYHISIDRQIELQKIKDNLELLVIERTKEIMHQKDEIEAQREEIEVQRDTVIGQKDEIENQNHLLSEKNKEISEKHSILLQQKEEILTQNQNLESLNLELENKNKIIANQRDDIKKELTETIVKTVELKNENIKSQLRAIANQMNPHFIFNTLNAIKYFIQKNDIKTSDLFLEKFAKLMRLTLYNSINETIAIKDEIETLKLYLELEQFRSNNKFSFKIEVENEEIINYHKIPSLFIQPFVENSIIHGVMPNEKTGHINLFFKDKDTHLLCIIEDNGIGRQKADELKKQSKNNHVSVGISLISQRLSFMSQIYKGDYSFDYIDLAQPENQITGTRVLLKIPIFQ